MFVKTYENLDSSAVNRLKIDKNSVFVTYQSNIDKEYEFNCENTEEFNNLVNKSLINKESIGKLLNKSIKEGKLVDITK
jgi:arginyl-tRNA--protein-N-Asp/Glu arginylyltransferase